MKEKLRITISGLGNRALPKNAEDSNWLGWVELIRRSDFFQLVAVHDVSEQSLQRIVETGCLKPDCTYQDIDLMLNSVNCNAILISNPAEYHASTIRKALECDLHVLAEKPFVKSTIEGKELTGLIEKKDKIVAIVQNWRSKDVGGALYRAIQGGVVGKIGSIYFRYIRDRENPNYPSYIFDEPYPLLYAMGIHHLDLFRYILKDEFLCVSGNSFKPPWSLYEFDTGLNLFYRMKSGVTINYTGTISSKNRMILQESLIIDGEKGTLFNESQWLEPPLWFYPQGKQERVNLTKEIKDTSISNQYNKSDNYVLENFYQAILNREEPLCNAMDGLRSVVILEASRLACETGKEIKVDNF